MPVQRGFIPGPMGAPYPGPQGGVQGFAPQGAQGFQQPLASQLVEGVSNFVAGFRDSKEKNKAAALQRAMQGIELKQKGLPVDDKKIAKDFRLAGVAFDYEGPTPLEQYEQQQAEFQQQQQAAIAGMMGPQPAMNRAMMGGASVPGMQQAGPPPPGMMGMPNLLAAARPMPGPMAAPPMPGMLPQAPSPQAMQADQQARNPGFWGQASRSMFGDQRPIPENAGVYRALDQMGGDATQQRNLQQLGIGVQKQQLYNAKNREELLSVFLNPEKHSPEKVSKAREMLQDIGAVQVIPLRDEVMTLAAASGKSIEEIGGLLLGEKMGVPAMQRLQMQMAERLAPNFPGEDGAPDVSKSLSYVQALGSGRAPSVTPSLSMKEQAESLRDGAATAKEYLGMDLNQGILLNRILTSDLPFEEKSKYVDAVSRTFPLVRDFDAGMRLKNYRLSERALDDRMRLAVSNEMGQRYSKLTELEFKRLDQIRSVLKENKGLTGGERQDLWREVRDILNTIEVDPFVVGEDGKLVPRGGPKFADKWVDGMFGMDVQLFRTNRPPYRAPASGKLGRAAEGAGMMAGELGRVNTNEGLRR
jgi:hypothetical protein